MESTDVIVRINQDIIRNLSREYGRLRASLHNGSNGNLKYQELERILATCKYSLENVLIHEEETEKVLRENNGEMKPLRHKLLSSHKKAYQLFKEAFIKLYENANDKI